MDFSRFFIDRPIFAAVLSIVIFAAGLIAIPTLPIGEYPEVVPPSVVVRTVYPGANPKVIAETVAGPLEQAITGVEDMLYHASQATADGAMTLTITFKLGTDIDKAQVQVQNRVAQALPKLPLDVQRIGVTTAKASPNITVAVFLYSPDGRYDQTYIANYAALRVKDELARLDGVGDVQAWGGGNYSMRVWLDPEKVAARGLTAGDVVAAIREQNVQVAAGQLGAPAAGAIAGEGSHPNSQVAINTQGRLVEEADFENIILRSGEDGQITRLRDVARVELGSDNYALRALLDGQTAVGIGIFQAPGANALEIRDQVVATMDELSARFPDCVKYETVYDTTGFVRDSIKAVTTTLLEAVALVVLALPAVAALFAVERDPRASDPVARAATARDWTRAEMLRDPLFPLVMLAMAPPAFIGNTIFFHQVHLAELRGWPPEVFASSFTLYAAMTIVFTLVSGQLVDRISGVALLPFYLLPLGLGCVVLGGGG